MKYNQSNKKTPDVITPMHSVTDTFKTNRYSTFPKHKWKSSSRKTRIRTTFGSSSKDQGNRPASGSSPPPLTLRRSSRFHRYTSSLMRQMRYMGRAILPALVVFYVLFCAVVLLMRYVLLPKITVFHDNIQQLVAQTVGLPVTIGAIHGDWRGWNPALRIDGVTLKSPRGGTLLHINRINGRLSWLSLLFFTPRFDLLELGNSEIQLGRNSEGLWTIAGEPLPKNTANGGSNSGALDWLLAQRRISLTDINVSWKDEMRDSPLLKLHLEALQITRDFKGHHLTLLAQSLTQSGQDVQIKADFPHVGSQLADWSGRLYMLTGKIDPLLWAPWITLPPEYLSGTGTFKNWLNISHGRISDVIVDLILQDVTIKLDYVDRHIKISQLKSSVGFEPKDGNTTMWARDVEAIIPGLPTFRARGLWWQNGEETRVAVSGVWLQDAGQLLAYLPTPATIRHMFDEQKPSGYLENFSLWRSDLGKYKMRGDWRDLDISAVGSFPGIKGISGTFYATDQSGQLQLEGGKSLVHLPQIFYGSAMPLTSLLIQVSWQKLDTGLRIDITKAQVSNDDVSNFDVSGSYFHSDVPDGDTVNLRGFINHANARNLWKYMPRTTGENLYSWLRDSLTNGMIKNAAFTFNGPMKDFPFDKTASGIFKITGEFQDAHLDYAKNWNPLKQANGQFEFVADRAKFKVHSATISDIPLVDFETQLTALGHNTHVLIDGQSKAAAQKFVDFVNQSPLKEYTDGALNEMTIDGEGILKLKLDIPLNNLASVLTHADFEFLGNNLTLMPALPQMKLVKGHLLFNEQGLSSNALTSTFLEGATRATISTQNKTMTINAEGTAATSAFARHYPHPWLQQLSGSIPWRMKLTSGASPLKVELDSTLVGMRSALPAPLSKDANTSRHFELVYEKQDRDFLRLRLGRLHGQFLLDEQGQIAKGFVVQGYPQNLPDNGLRIAIKNPELNVDSWLALIPKGKDNAPPVSIVLSTVELQLWEQKWHDVELNASNNGSQWQFQVHSKEVEGAALWNDKQKNLKANLNYLNLPQFKKSQTDQSTSSSTADWPAHMDVKIRRLNFNGIDYGAITANIENRGSEIQILGLSIDNEDFSFRSQGNWRVNAGSYITATVKTTPNGTLEKTLRRMKLFQGIEKGGDLEIKSELSWPGSLSDASNRNLTGKVNFSVKSGKFTKLEPGVGRFLSIFSLQSLPKRLSLDFNDIFSPGFSFDRISGEGTLTPGTFKISKMDIVGSSAAIGIDGTVDFIKESQDLNIVVVPDISDLASIGLTVVNPLVGGISFLVNHLLRTDRIFTKKYHLVGSWVDPQIQPIAVQTPSQSRQQNPLLDAQH